MIEDVPSMPTVELTDNTMTPNEISEWLDVCVLQLRDEEIYVAAINAAATIRELEARIEKLSRYLVHPDIEHYPLKAFLWKRENTGEWVLDIQGEINDTAFVVRHPQSSHLRPEEAVGLPELYATDAKLKIATEALEPFVRAADKLDGHWASDDWHWNDSVRSNVTVADIRKASQAQARIKGVE